MAAASCSAQITDYGFPGQQNDGFQDRPNSTCGSSHANAIEIGPSFKRRPEDCPRLTVGFSGAAGSFFGAGYSTTNLLRTGETLTLGAQIGVRLRRAELSAEKLALFGKPIRVGFTVHGERFAFNQERESSIFAFQRTIPQFEQFDPSNLLSYIATGYGAAAFVEYGPSKSSSRFRLAYRFDMFDIETRTEATREYFSNLNFQGGYGINVLTGIQTSRLIPSFTYNTIDNSVGPTHGTQVLVSTSVAGLGGDVNTIEPIVEVKHFRRGFRSGHVIGLHLKGRLITGYGGGQTPPFNRYYLGGENDIRGFDSWSISPIGFVASTATVSVLNNDGSQRLQKYIDSSGNITFANVTQSIPAYRPVSLGGDTSVVTNFEYRIPIRGPFTLALFADEGLNRATFKNQLQLSPEVIGSLNGLFPEANISGHISIQPETEKIRMSTGTELQVFLRRINAPLRFYWAYNPLALRESFHAPSAVDRSYFPNEPTYLNAVNMASTPLKERYFMFRFSIGRTF